MWGHMDGFAWGGGWGGMGLGMILFWGLVVTVLVIAGHALWSGNASSARQQDKSAFELLKERRYARGEIEREELEQKRRDLGA